MHDFIQRRLTTLTNKRILLSQENLDLLTKFKSRTFVN